MEKLVQAKKDQHETKAKPGSDMYNPLHGVLCSSYKGLNEKQLFHSHRLIKVILYLKLSVFGLTIAVLFPNNWQSDTAETLGKPAGTLSKN